MLLVVTNIPAIMYSKCYHRINYIKCSVGSIDLVIRTWIESYTEKICIRIGSNTNIVESYTINLNDFRYRCIKAYPQHQAAINSLTQFDIESLLRLLYRDIDDILVSHTFKDSESLTIYKDVSLDCSKLDALVSQFLTTNKIKQIMDKIDHENKAKEAKTRKCIINKL